MNSTHGRRRENRQLDGRDGAHPPRLFYGMRIGKWQKTTTRLIGVAESVLKGVTAKHPRQSVSKTSQNRLAVPSNPARLYPFGSPFILSVESEWHVTQ